MSIESRYEHFWTYCGEVASHLAQRYHPASSLTLDQSEVTSRPPGWSLQGRSDWRRCHYQLRRISARSVVEKTAAFLIHLPLFWSQRTRYQTYVQYHKSIIYFEKTRDGCTKTAWPDHHWLSLVWLVCTHEETDVWLCCNSETRASKLTHVVVPISHVEVQDWAWACQQRVSNHDQCRLNPSQENNDDQHRLPRSREQQVRTWTNMTVAVCFATEGTERTLSGAVRTDMRIGGMRKCDDRDMAYLIGNYKLLRSNKFLSASINVIDRSRNFLGWPTELN